MSADASPPRKTLSGWSKAAVDYGPLIVFFLVNTLTKKQLGDDRIYVATGAFMGSMLVAMAYSWLRTRHIPVLLWVSGVLVVGLGAVTLFLKDATFIKIKPTAVFLLFAAVLSYGLFAKRPLLKLVLGPALPMTDRGWTLLTRNWIAYFLLSAALNEIIWRNFSTDIWVHFDTWGSILLSFLFLLTQIPVLTKHMIEEPAQGEGSGMAAVKAEQPPGDV